MWEDRKEGFSFKAASVFQQVWLRDLPRPQQHGAVRREEKQTWASGSWRCNGNASVTNGEASVAVGFQVTLCASVTVSQHREINPCTDPFSRGHWFREGSFQVVGDVSGSQAIEDRVPDQLKVKAGCTDWANISRPYKKESTSHSPLCSQLSTLSCSGVGF